MSEPVIVRQRVQHPGGGKLMTKQADVGNADINAIVRRARIAGALPPPQSRPRFGDFTGVTDFHDAMDRLIEAEEEFERLPARVRSACANDLGVFVETASTPEGLAELMALGLKPEQAPGADPAPEPVAEPDPAAPVPE